VIWLYGVGFGVAAYLLGAIPVGLLVARIKGVDIRKVGSGNVGATNVFRSVSKPLGILTFFLDALKGFVPAFFFPAWLASCAGGGVSGPLAVVYGVVAVAGHNWPVYLRFKGGKGIATSTGALLGFAPPAAGIGLVVWVVVFLASRYVSLASIAACVTVPVAGWILFFLGRGDGWVVPVTLTALGVVGAWRHKANVQRLLNGTEHRFGNPKKG
jgi:glycerol-3-phosphate acyltransferase PlsY